MEKKGVSELIRLLGDNRPARRKNAAYALGKLGDKRAVIPFDETFTIEIESEGETITRLV